MRTAKAVARKIHTKIENSPAVGWADDQIEEIEWILRSYGEEVKTECIKRVHDEVESCWSAGMNQAIEAIRNLELP